MNKTVVARAGMNDIGCPIVVRIKKNRSERCYGTAFIPISLQMLAFIRTFGQRTYNDVQFHCGHKHTVTLAR